MSGSSASERDVKPTRSQKITDTTRSSPATAISGAARPGVVSGSKAVGAPHDVQNFFPVASGDPHAAHRCATGAPHSPQNRSSGPTSSPHVGHPLTRPPRCRWRIVSTGPRPIRPRNLAAWAGAAGHPRRDVRGRRCATRSRKAKVEALAELLRSLDPDEVEVAVGFLTGAARQGRIGVGWRTAYRDDVEPADGALGRDPRGRPDPHGAGRDGGRGIPGGTPGAAHRPLLPRHRARGRLRPPAPHR